MIDKVLQTLPTYTWLANEGIIPETIATYSLSTLTSALQAQSASFTDLLVASADT